MTGILEDNCLEEEPGRPWRGEKSGVLGLPGCSVAGVIVP